MLADRFARRSVNSPISAFRRRGSMNGFTELPRLPVERWLCRSCPWRRPAPGTFGRSPGGRAANRDVHPWFASDSPLEGAGFEPSVPGDKRGSRHRKWQDFCTCPPAGYPAVRRCGDVRLCALVKGRMAWLLCLPVGQASSLASSYSSTLFFRPVGIDPVSELSASDDHRNIPSRGCFGLPPV